MVQREGLMVKLDLEEWVQLLSEKGELKGLEFMSIGVTSLQGENKRAKAENTVLSSRA